MDSKILLGIIAVTIFGSFAAQSMMAQAGVGGLVMTEVTGEGVVAFPGDPAIEDVVQCPPGFQLISGDYFIQVVSQPGPETVSYTLDSRDANFVSNEYKVRVTFTAGNVDDVIIVVASAHCGQLTFPMQMGMIGGQLLDINTLPLLVGAIGTNPIITGLVGITLAGVAAQAVWFVHKRKKNNSGSI